MTAVPHKKTSALAIGVAAAFAIVIARCIFIEDAATTGQSSPTPSASAAAQAAAAIVAERERRVVEQKAAFAANKPAIIAEMGRLARAGKYEDAAIYAKGYDTIDDADLRKLQQDVDARLDAALAAKVKAQARKEGVRVGMTKEQALGSSWGKPQKINTTTNTYGTREQWVYGSGNYLYFEGGILTSIQN